MKNPLDDIVADVHKAMIEAIAFEINQPPHMLIANRKFNDQMRIAARAAVQDMAERLGRLDKDFDRISESGWDAPLSHAVRKLTAACLREPK